MFLGHYAVGLAAKRAAPRISLGVLVAASQLIDLLWPFFLIAGLEGVRIDPGNTAATPLDFYHYPWTHSMLMTLVWSGLAGAIVFAFRRRIAEALVIAGVVFSHWLLDLLSHRPDLPILPGGDAKVGLGLWRSLPATIGVEMLLFGFGAAIYLATTRPARLRGTVVLWALIGFLAVVYFASLFGPPPPSEDAIAWSALLLWLTPLWAWWADRNRVVSSVRNGS
jgi:membrane-bound metal-dependent hydrolase YbcI (DUF457 family)